MGKIVTVAQMATPVFGPGNRVAKEGFKCTAIPADVVTSQFLRVVIKYVEARPERMHEPLHLLALDAFFDAWPCKK